MKHKRNRTVRRQMARDAIKFKKELGINSVDKEAQLIGRLISEIEKGNAKEVQAFLEALPPPIGQEYATIMEKTTRQAALMKRLVATKA